MNNLKNKIFAFPNKPKKKNIYLTLALKNNNSNNNYNIGE